MATKELVKNSFKAQILMLFIDVNGKTVIVTDVLCRYGQLDNVFVPANKGFGFVTFFRASAVRFVLGTSSSVLLKVSES